MKGLWPVDANKLQLLKIPGIHLIKWLLHSPELAGLGSRYSSHRKLTLCFSEEANMQPLCLLYTWWRGGQKPRNRILEIDASLRNYGMWLSSSSGYLSLVAAPYSPYILVISLIIRSAFPSTENRKLVFPDCLAATAQVWGLVSTNWVYPWKTWIQKQAMGGGGQVWDTQYADHQCGGGFSFFRAPSTQTWAALRLRSNGCDSEVFTKIVPIAWLAQLSGPPGVCESPNILWKLLFLTHTSHSGSCYL